MSAPFLQQIDWQRPWLTPFRASAEPLLQAPDWRAELNALASAKSLYNHRHLPIQFVPQASLPPDTAYEAFISATGGVPTRDNPHDFFNALVWLTFPQIKIQLNALQAAEIANGLTKSRGKLRDAATIFDENAALLVVRDVALLEALRAHRWHEVFVARRDRFEGGCEVCLFGHALMEKLITPYKAITAHTWIVLADDVFFTLPPADKTAWIDASVAAQLTGRLTTSGLSPLPVLGVPGWWDKQDATFYADADVFRPKRMAAHP